MKKILIILIGFILFSLAYVWVNASINFTVSPTKYEIEALKWTIINREATLYNYSKESYTITTWKANFTTDWQTWIPKILVGENLTFPDQQLASWIEIETISFIIAPWEKKKINFKINIPQDATPWWHYWAIFFKNNSTKLNSTSNEIWVNIDYGILLLVNVDWKIIKKWAPKDIIIKNNGGSSSYLSRSLRSNNNIKWKDTLLSFQKDNCPIYDFTNSNFDWKCILWPSNNNKSDNKVVKQKSFNTSFEIPFKNEWNTHIKPKWKIILIDQDWNELKWIWQEIIKNKKWTVIWEKIVDYLPINDIWWNVLPYSKRDFNLYWKWFSYKTYDNEWNEIIKYWNPSEYYTKKNIENRSFIMFWERYSERIKHRKITALIDLSYKDNKWEKVSFNSAKEFYVDYKESYIWYNPYIIILLVILWIIAFIIYIKINLSKIKCTKCERKISNKSRACIYCWKKVKSKKEK